jgi:hypothetical protein
MPFSWVLLTSHGKLKLAICSSVCRYSVTHAGTQVGGRGERTEDFSRLEVMGVDLLLGVLGGVLLAYAAYCTIQCK